MTLDPSERYRLLSWLAEELRTQELTATVVRQNGQDASAVLRSLNTRGEIRFVKSSPRRHIARHPRIVGEAFRSVPGP